MLGTIPTDDDKVITGSRIPTRLQVILCLFAHYDPKQQSFTKREVANITIDNVMVFNNKVRIPLYSITK